MYCGILSYCDSKVIAAHFSLPRFAVMGENNHHAASMSPLPMDARSEPATSVTDIEDDISVGSASPPPPPLTDTDDSMPMVEEIETDPPSCKETPETIDKEKTAEGERREELQEIRAIRERRSEAADEEELPESSSCISPGGEQPTPPVAHQGNNGVVIQRALKFSIDNILKPEFGRRLSDDQPVDLSRVNCNEAPCKRPPQLSTAAAGSPPAAAQSKADPQPDKEKYGSDSTVWPAWVYCTRYSDRPSAGPRTRRIKKRDKKDEKRPRTAFTSDQLAKLKKEFQENRYLTEKRRQDLARDLGLNESQIKIWFQNKRAKIKKQVSGAKNPLALQLMAQGLYNHSTIPVREEDEENLLSSV